jgi:hypothetical protein
MDEQLEQPEPQWLTYVEAAERLNVSPQAVRMRANRYHWRKQTGNDGKARVLVTLEPRSPEEHPLSTRSSPARKSADQALVAALEAHVQTLQAELASEKARSAAAEQRSDAAIAALGRLADELAKLAEERARPWWRRIRIAG